MRILSYTSLLYQDLIKQDAGIRGTKKLPPILPLVLYNGERPWTSPLDFNALLPDNLPKALRKYQPSFKFWLLDEGRYRIDTKETGSDNLVSLLICLEQAKEPAQIEVVEFETIPKDLNGCDPSEPRPLGSVH